MGQRQRPPGPKTTQRERRMFDTVGAHLQSLAQFTEKKRDEIWDAMLMMDNRLDDVEPWLEKTQLHDEWLHELRQQLAERDRGKMKIVLDRVSTLLLGILIGVVLSAATAAVALFAFGRGVLE